MTDEWYQGFPGGMDSADLFEVIAAANYMTIKPLLDLACLWITFQMMGKNTSQVSNLIMDLSCYLFPRVTVMSTPLPLSLTHTIFVMI